MTFRGREIPEERIRVAIASPGFYSGALILGCYLRALGESPAFGIALFRPSGPAEEPGREDLAVRMPRGPA